MSRRIEIYPAPYGMVRLEIWVNGRRTSMTESISQAAAQTRVEAMGGTSAEVVDHTEHKFKTPDNVWRARL